MKAVQSDEPRDSVESISARREWPVLLAVVGISAVACLVALRYGKDSGGALLAASALIAGVGVREMGRSVLGKIAVDPRLATLLILVGGGTTVLAAAVILS